VETEAHSAQVLLEVGQRGRHFCCVAQERDVVGKGEVCEVLASLDAAEDLVDGHTKVGHARDRAEWPEFYKTLISSKTTIVENGLQISPMGGWSVQEGAHTSKLGAAMQHVKLAVCHSILWTAALTESDPAFPYTFVLHNLKFQRAAKTRQRQDSNAPHDYESRDWVGGWGWPWRRVVASRA
jgi:hypothetical protein